MEIPDLDLKNCNNGKRRRNPRFSNSSRQENSTSGDDKVKHDPTYENRKTVYPRGGETFEEQEYFVKEKYDLSCEIAQLKKDCVELRQQIEEKEIEDVNEIQAREAYLQHYEHDKYDKDEPRVKAKLMSSKLEKYHEDMIRLDEELKCCKARLSQENHKELTLCIVQQRTDMVELSRQLELLNQSYQETVREMHSQTMIKAKSVYDEQVSIIDQLNVTLQKYRETGMQLSNELEDLQNPRPVSMENLQELDKLKRRYKRLLHKKLMLSEDCRSLETQHKAEVEMFQEMKQREKKEKSAKKERIAFKEKSAPRKMYKSRGAYSIAADKIEYPDASAPKKETVKTQKTEKKATTRSVPREPEETKVKSRRKKTEATKPIPPPEEKMSVLSEHSAKTEEEKNQGKITDFEETVKSEEKISDDFEATLKSEEKSDFEKSGKKEENTSPEIEHAVDSEEKKEQTSPSDKSDGADSEDTVKSEEHKDNNSASEKLGSEDNHEDKSEEEHPKENLSDDSENVSKSEEKSQKEETLGDDFDDTMKQTEPESLKDDFDDTIKSEKHTDTLKEAPDKSEETLGDDFDDTFKSEKNTDTLKDDFDDTIKSEKNTDTLKEAPDKSEETLGDDFDDTMKQTEPESLKDDFDDTFKSEKQTEPEPGMSVNDESTAKLSSTLEKDINNDEIVSAEDRDSDIVSGSEAMNSDDF